MLPSFVPEEYDSSQAMIMGSDSVDDEEVVEQCAYPSSSPLFSVGQTVLLCCDDEESNAGRYYIEVIIRKVRCSNETTDEWSFLVQQKEQHGGLNSKRERWVSKNDLLPINACETFTRTSTNNGANKKRKQDDSDETPSVTMTISSPVSRRRRKYGSRSPSTSSGATVRSPAVDIDDFCDLPGTLRNILAEECECITKKGLQNVSDCGASPRPLRRLHDLPATLTVKQLLQHFEKKKRIDMDENSRVHLQQFCDEIARLFDSVLTTSLLYPEEVLQYKSTFFGNANDKLGVDARPCEVYGCHFLLRLLFRLPQLLHVVQSEPAKNHHLHSSLLVDLIVLLQKNRQVCFRHSYREPTYEELLDWEKALVDDPDFGCTTIATVASVESSGVEEDGNQTDMAITPTKQQTRTHFIASRYRNGTVLTEHLRSDAEEY